MPLTLHDLSMTVDIFCLNKCLQVPFSKFEDKTVDGPLVFYLLNKANQFRIISILGLNQAKMDGESTKIPTTLQSYRTGVAASKHIRALTRSMQG